MCACVMQFDARRGPTFVRRGASFLSPHLRAPHRFAPACQAAQGRRRAAVCFRCRRCMPVVPPDRHRTCQRHDPPIRTPNRCHCRCHEGARVQDHRRRCQGSHLRGRCTLHGQARFRLGLFDMALPCSARSCSLSPPQLARRCTTPSARSLALMPCLVAPPAGDGFMVLPAAA